MHLKISHHQISNKKKTFSQNHRSSMEASYSSVRDQEREVDPAIWMACAGTTVHVPRVGDSVVYSPELHSHHASSPIHLLSQSHAVPCQVASVRLLVDRDTDEVFYRLTLRPTTTTTTVGGGGESTDSVVVGPPPEAMSQARSFAKVLSKSDANNGGALTVPKSGAESIFPPLNKDVTPRMQTIVVRDLHGKRWEFTHVYRGEPLRHLLRTGWSKFNDHKKLVAGDTVVFIRSSPGGELSIGIRRANYGGLSTEVVVECIRAALAGNQFVVECYPREGQLEYVMKNAHISHPHNPSTKRERGTPPKRTSIRLFGCTIYPNKNRDAELV
ncbi:Auxin response factor 10 [Acorus gramineus]|uniref:Auxin response factor 10 n=1 Tax=Acorus gramineus TaxID=55184 RepID=A0AAV9BA57_ACOGR|nr:Auxin response factor 10 [Acorus gramineus]